MTDDGKLIQGLTARIEQSSGVIGVSLGHRVNVFIEMGIALALRKKCIMLSDHPDGFGMLRSCIPTLVLGDRDTSIVQLRSLLDAQLALSSAVSNWR